MGNHKRLIGGIALVAAGLLALAAGPCVEQRSLDKGLGYFRVTLTGLSGVTGGDGTPADPYAYPEGEVVLTFNATAYDKQGMVMDCQADHLCYEEVANVFVHPTAAQTGFWAYDAEVPIEMFAPLQFTAGRVEAATASVRNLHGRANLTVVDMRPVSACESDGDCWGGLRCLEGYCSVQGVLKPIPQGKIGGSMAMGASRNVYFDPPSLRNIQVDDRVMSQLDIDYSALERQFVDIDCRKQDLAAALPDDGHGKLVVTGIFNEGFFVTDLADAGLGFNHLYVYNYSYPDDLALGDRLDRLVGTSADFSGATQISFPSWSRAVDARLNPEPFRIEDIDAVVPPVLVTTAMCEDSQSSSMHMCGHSKNNWVLEELESARVRLQNLRMPDIFVDCDFNANGEITFSYPTPDEETDCRDACLEHDGSMVVTAREIIAKPEVMDVIVNLADHCTTHADCASGQCGGYKAEDDDGFCRVICPWEAEIPDIRSNCIDFRVPPQFICSELSTMRQFGQWSVALDNGAGPLVNLLTRESLVNLDPSRPEFLGTTIDYVQGNLRQVRAARPRWIVLVGLGEADSPTALKD